MINGLGQLFRKADSPEQAQEETGDKKKKLKKEQWFLIILCGILLIILAVPAKKKTAGQTAPGLTGGSTDSAETLSQEPAAETNWEEMTLEEYTVNLEKKLEEILSEVAGAGEVRVVISMASSTEKVVEKEQPVNRSNTAETDSQGGSRNINSVEMGDTAVYSTQNGASEPYVVKVIQPKVEGVMVVAQGAGSGSVNKNLTEAIQALFGIEAHKIKVLKMKTPVG